MSGAIDFTHDAAATSWVISAQAQGCDFTLQNLPHGVFSRGAEAARGGVAIGDQVLDLAHVASLSLLTGLAQQACEAAAQGTLNAFMGMGQPAWRALRHGLFGLLSSRATQATRDALSPCLVPQAQLQMRLPVQVHNYTDFYTSVHHANNVGRVIRPDDPLTPNFKWLPIAYHGRASSVVVSGTPSARALPTTVQAFRPTAPGSVTTTL